MLNWLERQRQKPKAVRVRVAFLIAIVGTALVALVWMLTLPVRLGSLELSPGNTENTDERGAMFEELNTTIEEGRNVVERAIGNAQSASSAPATTSPGTTTRDNPFPTRAPSTTSDIES